MQLDHSRSTTRSKKPTSGDLGQLLGVVRALERTPRFRPLSRSFDVYYRDAARHTAMDAIYVNYLGAGDLGFDIGSHVGDRIASFRRLGARVVACEPQPNCVSAIDALYSDDDGVTLIGAACGAEVGKLTMQINSANPTVSTLSADLVRASRDADGWREQKWDEDLTVPVTTLDHLIGEHGVPRFIKLDVEGFEAEALAGLSVPVRALSFEFTTIQRDVALKCLDRLNAIGRYRFNIALGESQSMMFERPVDASAMADKLTSLPHSANSGDIYAELTPE